MIKKVKVTFVAILLAAIFSIPCFADVHPTGGWNLKADGTYMSTDGTAGLGYGYGAQAFLGADINRWSQFFGEIAVSCAKEDYPLSRFTQLQPPLDLMLGGGWTFSPGAGLSFSLSGGFDLMKISTYPEDFAAGLYASFTPKWTIGPIPTGNPYYNITLSVPVQASFAGDSIHFRMGVSLGFDVSIYQTRRGNSFTGGSL